MPARSFLAFDLGAESGRAIIGELAAGTLQIREIRRFANDPVAYGASLHWDAPRLWHEMREALATIRNMELTSLAVDTWGVDYALVGEDGELLQNPFHYRDRRGSPAMDEVLRLVPKEDVYAITGIQFLSINTINQLTAARLATPRLLAAADRFVMMPDLFNYWLTGRLACELTNATTTQLVDARAREWSAPLMARLDLPARLAPEIVEAGSMLGTVRAHAAGGLFTGTAVVSTASHDTASAVASIAARDGVAFVSSGTWSLVGAEMDAPVLSSEAMRLNFSNEGGVAGTTRLLKNVMGLWMLQGCRRSWAEAGRPFEYEALMAAADAAPAFAHLVDPDDASFTAPASMPEAIDTFCAKTGQARPASPGACTRAVLESLAFKYRLVLRQLERLTGRATTRVRIIGGGAKNRLLNQFTADATGCEVDAGPFEATAIGNIAVQMMACGAAASLAEARAVIERSFPTERFVPRRTDRWDREWARFLQYCEHAYV